MKKTVIIISAVLICGSASAQGFLKGLKEVVSEEISRGVADGKDAVGGAKDAVGSIFSGKKKSEAKKYGVVKPSSAKNAAELLNELPDFPTAAQIAENEDGFRNHFYDRIYAVENRMDELKRLNMASSREDDERVEANILKKMTGLSSPADVMSASGAGNVQKEAGETDAEKMERLQEELQVLSARIESGRATEADMKRAGEITEEISNIYSSMMNGMNLGALMEMAENSSRMTAEAASRKKAVAYELENDLRYSDLLSRLSGQSAAEGGSDAGKTRETEALASIDATFRKIWSETDDAEVRNLYASVNGMIEKFEITRAQARLDQNAELKGQYLSLISEAEKISSGYSVESLVPRYEMLNLPYAVVEAYKNLLYNVWGSSDDVYASDAVCPVKKTKINLPLEAGDVLYSAESNIYQMLDDGKIASVYGFAKESEDVEEEFLRNAVLLVKNSKDGKFYKIQNGSRTALGKEYNRSYDFRKDYYYKERREAQIPMKSLKGKTLTFNSSHTLFIPIPNSGHYYDVLAIQRTEDWIAFITLDGDGQLCKCLFRL